MMMMMMMTAIMIVKTIVIVVTIFIDLAKPKSGAPGLHCIYSYWPYLNNK